MLMTEIARLKKEKNAFILAHNYAPRDVWRSAPFWLMYAMFVLVGAGGLVLHAQLAPIANDYNIANVPVSILGLTLPALSLNASSQTS